MDIALKKRMPKLSWQLFICISFMFLLFAGCFIIYQEQRERQFKVALLSQQLQNYNEHLNEALQTMPLEDSSLNLYIASHPVPSIRITILDDHGYVLYDNKTDKYPNLSDHRSRKEIRDAVAKGSGYDISRVSSSVGEAYFYSATFFPDRNIIIRSALPYDEELPQSLKADKTFLWFALSLILVLTLALYWLTARIANAIDRKQEKASFELQKELTQNLAHEFKTPIAEIRAYLETLQSTPGMPEETRTHFIERSFVLSRRLSDLTEDLSTLDAIESDRSSLSFEDIDVVSIISQAVRESENAMARHKQVLRLNLPESIPVKGNAKLIFSIFKNLIDNAVLYAGEGSTLCIEAWHESNRWRFAFSDDGHGVPEKSLAKLYERFYRTDKGRSREFGGTGLGLAIVKDAVVFHGGDIRAEPVLPHGLKHEFWIMESPADRKFKGRG